MVDSDIITLLLIVETISIIIAIIVIALELWIHKSTVQILKTMDKFSTDMEASVSKQIKRIDDHVDDLDKHSHRMEKNIKELLKENESIYNKVCQPNLKLDDD